MKKKDVGSLGILILSAALLLAGSPSARAGIVLTDDEGNHTLISGGKLKSMTQESEGEWIVADFVSGRITLVSPEEERAYSGTIEEYCRFIETMFSQAGEMGRPSGAGAAEINKKPAFRVSKEGPGGPIAGFSTTKYKVTADGRLYEELWVADDPALLRELGNIEHIRAFNSCALVMEPDGLENDPAYRKIFSSGWVVRHVSYEEGEQEALENIVSSQKKTIPDLEFKVPSGYEILPFSEAVDPDALKEIQNLPKDAVAPKMPIP